MSTMNSVQRRLMGHAALIMLIGFAAGVGLLVSAVGGIEVFPGKIIPIALFGSVPGWTAAHLGGMLNAILMIVVALMLPVLGFSPKTSGYLGVMLIGTGWANTLFYWASLASPNQALTFGANRFGPASLAAVVGLLPALVFVVVAIVAFVMIARQAFRPGSREV